MNFINKQIKTLFPYKLASHKIWDVSTSERKKILKLDWNEATIPPSPKVKSRLKHLLEDESFFNLYPSTNNTQLLNLLSNYVNLPIDNIQYFSSSDSIHEYLNTIYVSEGDNILIAGPTYDNFRLTTQSNGGVINYHNYNIDFYFNHLSFSESIKKINPKIIYICNPNNPSGNLIDKNILIKLIKSFPDSLFIIDEAYYEFTGVTLSDNVKNLKNLIITRTFSKAFALANFRFGYMISNSENIENISKVRNSKNISTLCQESAIAVLEDISYMKNYVKSVKIAREWFCENLKNIKLYRQSNRK